MKRLPSLSMLFTGLAFLTGIFGFMSGEYIISSALFAVTTYASSMLKS